ncbi:biotin transporter BioY [Sphingomonas baiyangensis]|uniref:Biotin transporter n=1 Tax=Sphingomonas baiyangensis TaxID=2572576 RepID=A0A4U1L6U9_9SPHN|nr:biotin transporter BioY [Sphingomonas baiyangensis]TKD52035.1 biotin transporter BioY [Sphingomonas baiyangensis]
MMALVLASYVAIPMQPVPITLQTLVVPLIGALLGARLGTAAVLAWLAAGALGAPVLAEGASGIARFTGPGGGYLAAFPMAAWLVGRLAARGWAARPGRALGLMLAANALCLALGGLWLAAAISAKAAIASGVLPFLPGALAKSAAGAGILLLLSRRTAAPAFRPAS